MCTNKESLITTRSTDYTRRVFFLPMTISSILFPMLSQNSTVSVYLTMRMSLLMIAMAVLQFEECTKFVSYPDSST
jgi:hypothetical protein